MRTSSRARLSSFVVTSDRALQSRLSMCCERRCVSSAFVLASASSVSSLAFCCSFFSTSSSATQLAMLCHLSQNGTTVSGSARPAALGEVRKEGGGVLRRHSAAWLRSVVWDLQLCVVAVFGNCIAGGLAVTAVWRRHSLYCIRASCACASAAAVGSCF